MSDPVMIALVSTLPATIAAIAAFVTSVSNGRKANAIKDQNTSIHTLVNGDRKALQDELSRTRVELAQANATIARERLMRGHR